MDDYTKIYQEILNNDVDPKIAKQQQQQIITEMFNGDPRQYTSFLKQMQQYISMAINKELLRLQHEITNIKTDINNIKTQVANIKTQVVNIKTQVANIKTQVDNIKTQVDNIKNTLKRNDIY